LRHVKKSRRKRESIQILRNDGSRDSFNAKTEANWAVLFSTRAHVASAPSKQESSADKVSVFEEVKMTLNNSSETRSILPSDRIRWSGKDFEISSLPIPVRGVDIEIIATTG